MYQIISEKIESGVITTIFRASNGALVTMREPIHTPEEQQKINNDFLVAAAAICYPGKDISNVSKISMIC